MIVVRTCAAAEVKDILQPAISPKTDPHGLHSLDDILSTGACHQVLNDGVMIAAYVLEGFGSELWITAAAGSADFDLTDVIDIAADKQGKQFDRIAFTTVRRGLIKKALAKGYECKMVKTLRK